MSTTAQAAPRASDRPGSRALLLIPLAGLVLGLLASLLLGPHAPRLQGQSGDAQLAQRARALISDPSGYQALSITEVRGQQVSHARLGQAPPLRPDTADPKHFQLGSITKTFNGMLLADAVTRGEVRMDQPVGELLPELAGSPAATLTLTELATHHSGLPSMLPDEMLMQTPMWLSGRSAFRADVPTLLRGVRDIPLTNRGKFAYSNLSASLLGHGLARRAGFADWPQLVEQRLFGPLGMTDTVIATSPEQIPADGVRGQHANGRELEPWCSAGMAPAGSSTWTTEQDMTRYAQAILDGRAPGMAAFDFAPVDGLAPSIPVGLHWFHQDYKGRQLIFHNGSTQGGTSMLILDRQAHSAVLVLSASGRGPETLARQLLTDGKVADKPNFEGLARVNAAVTVTWLVCLIMLAAAALRRRTRLAWLPAAVDMSTLSIVAASLGWWDRVPPLVFGGGCGLGLGLVGYAALTWRGQPWAAKHALLSWIRFGLAVLVLLMVLGVRLFLP